MKIEADIDLTSRQLAEAFCEMNDDEQTRCFGDVAAVMETWAPHKRLLQVSFIGSHLVDCDCGGERARELITGIYEAMTESK